MNNKDIRYLNCRYLVTRRTGGLVDMANRLQKEQSQVSQFAGKTRKKNVGDMIASQIEAAYELNKGWMDQIHADEWKRVGLVFDLPDEPYKVRELNANPYVVLGGKVPLISWVRAGNWDEAIDSFNADDAEDWLLCPPNCRAENTFALTVKGPSMDDGTARGYRDGEQIFVDTSKTSPEHNADVIVRNGEGHVTFKRLINADGKWYLKPLNPQWPEPIIHFSENCHLIGRVMFSGQVRG